MERFHQTMPGYRLNEYLLVLQPNEELRNRITALRNDFNERYRPEFALTGKPHLSLVRFHTWSMLEEKVVNRFKHIAMGYTPFRIDLKDYGSFPTHSIFIQVAVKSAVQDLIRELRTAQKLMKVDPDHPPLFITEPYIPIARKLAPRQYEQGWLEFRHRHFTAKMLADGMLLLKRTHPQAPYQIVQRFEFQHLPVGVTQGELFF